MATKLNRWGNSLGLRLPQYVVERAGLVAGDHLYIRLLDSGEIMIRSVKADCGPAEYRIVGEEARLPKSEPEQKW